MANIEGMANKFVVIKIDDINKYCTELEKRMLDGILENIIYKRQLDGKGNNSYVVINTDEPYIDQIIDIIKAHGHWG